jgi:RAB6A-GEF complex partner protein 1
MFNDHASPELGDPAEDLSVATVLMMVGGNLILLRPTRVRLDSLS